MAERIRVSTGLKAQLLCEARFGGPNKLFSIDLPDAAQAKDVICVELEERVSTPQRSNVDDRTWNSLGRFNR